MSGAVMLLMLASAGITYGWTPDGGNGVKYIIQIPPNQMEQVARAGELTSQIPAEIRGHVTEVVIRIGQGDVPRVTPPHLAMRGPGSMNTDPNQLHSGTAGMIASGDYTPVPIQAMDGPAELRPIGGVASPSIAMMQPSPQGGGFSLPNGFNTPASNSPSTARPSTAGPSTMAGPSTNFAQSARETANNIGNEFRSAVDSGRQQVQQNFNATTDRLGDAASGQMQSATNGMRQAAGQLFNPQASASNTADDPRARLSTPSTNDPNSTNAFNPNVRSSNGRASSTNESVAPPAFTNSRSQTPDTQSSNTQTRAPLNSQTEEEWFDLNNRSRRRPSTDPLARDDSQNTNSGFAGSNFGRLPAGLESETAPQDTRNGDTRSRNASTGSTFDNRNSTASNNTASNNTSNNLNYDSNLTPAQAALLPENGWSFDAENFPVDFDGYRLDRFGRRVDRQGNLLTAEDSITNPRDDGRGSFAGFPSNSNDALSPDTRSRNGNSFSTNPNSGSQFPANNFPAGNFAGTNFAGNDLTGNGSSNNGGSTFVQPPMAPQNASNNPAMNNGQLNNGQYGNGQYSNGQFNNGSNNNGSSNNGSSNNGSFAGNPSNLGMSPTLGPGMPGYNQHADSRLAGHSNLSSSDTGTRSQRDDELGSALDAGTLDAVRSPEQIAAQPIFNALLLFSIMANIYLLVWLKNLRLQFRDIVASKRASSSAGTLATGI